MRKQAIVSAVFFSLALQPAARCEEIDDDPEDDLPVTLELPDVEVEPGQTVDIPVFVRNEVPLSMTAFSVEFEPSVASVDGVGLSIEVEEILARNPAGNSSFVWHFDDSVGWVQAAVVTDFTARPENAIPPGRTPVARVSLKVKEDAPLGEYPLEFTERETAEYEGEFEDEAMESVYNWVRREGGEFEEENEFEDGDVPIVMNGSFRVRILGDIDIFAFRRGDTNADRSIDISDPIGLLSYLFLGTSTMSCEDASDANDDGQLDISDAITLLDFLFDGVHASYQLTGRMERDQTPDSLHCSAY